MSRMWSSPRKFDEAFEALSVTDKAAAFEVLKTSVSICIRCRQQEHGPATYELIPQWENYSVSMQHNMMDDVYEFRDGNGHEVFIGAPKQIVDDMTAPLADQAGFTPPYVPMEIQGGREELNRILNEYPKVAGDVSYTRDPGPQSFTQAELDEAIALAARSDELMQSPDLADALAYSFTKPPKVRSINDGLSFACAGTVEVHPSMLKTKELYAMALDELAFALTEHNHVWTPQQRALFDEAHFRLGTTARSLAKEVS